MVMVLEALDGFEGKYEYSVVGHSGAAPAVRLVPWGAPPATRLERLKLVPEAAPKIFRLGERSYFGRRRDSTEYPRRRRGVAATRPPRRNIHAVAAASPRLASAEDPTD